MHTSHPASSRSCSALQTWLSRLRRRLPGSQPWLHRFPCGVRTLRRTRGNRRTFWAVSLLDELRAAREAMPPYVALILGTLAVSIHAMDDGDPISVFGGFGGYPTPTDVTRFASAVAQQLADSSSLHLLGQTIEGRSIHAILLGNCTKDHHAITYVAMHHAREVRPSSTRVAHAWGIPAPPGAPKTSHYQCLACLIRSQQG